MDFLCNRVATRHVLRFIHNELVRPMKHLETKASNAKTIARFDTVDSFSFIIIVHIVAMCERFNV